MEEKGDGTLLRMTESGFAGLTGVDELVRRRYEANSAGLPRIIEALRRDAEQFVP